MARLVLHMGSLAATAAALRAWIALPHSEYDLLAPLEFVPPTHLLLSVSTALVQLEDAGDALQPFCHMGACQHSTG